MAKSNLYKNLDALEPIKKLLSEAGSGLAESTRNIDTSSMKEVLGAVLGSGVGVTGSFAALYFAGTVGLSAVGISSGLAALGGTMVAGIGVLALPVVVLGVGGYALVVKRNKKRLVQAKEALLQEAVAKLAAVTKSLETRVNLSEERAKYLEALNISLRTVINDLQRDLEPA